MESKMVEVHCTVGTRVRQDRGVGTVKSLLREGDERSLRIVALVYWDGGRKSFEQEKTLKAVTRG